MYVTEPVNGTHKPVIADAIKRLGFRYIVILENDQDSGNDLIVAAVHNATIAASVSASLMLGGTKTIVKEL